MAGAGYFLRSQGRVIGPFDVEKLRGLVRRGTLARHHAISTDQVNWIPATNYAELFPAAVAATVATAVHPSPEPPPEPADEAYAAPAAPAAADVRYYYTQNGATAGPVAMQILQLLARNGTLSADDLVWQVDAEISAAAGQMSELAPLFSADQPPAWQGEPAPPAPSPATPVSLGYEQPRVAHGAGRRFDSVAKVAGITSGAVLLICLLPPWFAAAGHTFWWWDLYQAPKGEILVTFCTYLMLAGIALCILPAMTRGLARGIAMTSISALAFLFLLAISLTGGNDSPTSAFSLLVPMALATLLGACSFRAAVPASSAGRVVSGACGGVISLGVLTGGAIGFSRNHNFSNLSFDGTPAGAVLGLVLLLLGCLCALAAGVMALVGLRSLFSARLNRATWLCALGGLVLPAVGVFVLFLGVFDALAGFFSSSNSPSLLEDPRFLATQALLRVVLLWGALIASLAAGLPEWLFAVGATARRGV